jgi:hypothetical protein
MCWLNCYDEVVQLVWKQWLSWYGCGVSKVVGAQFERMLWLIWCGCSTSVGMDVMAQLVLM